MAAKLADRIKQRQAAEAASGAEANGHANGREKRKLELNLFKPEFYSMYELARMDTPEPTAVIQDLVFEGLNFLNGRPKSGKSYVALNLALAVASGGLALGSLKTAKGTVLYVALEDHKGRLKKRGMKMLDGRPEPRNLIFANRWPRLDAGGEAIIHEFVRDHPDTKLIVMDTFSRIRARAGSAGSAYDEDYSAVSGIQEFGLDKSIGVLLVHHDSKKEHGNDDPTLSMGGSTGLSGAADGIIAFRRAGPGMAQITAVGRDAEDRKLALEWDRRLETWNCSGEGRRLSGVQGEVENAMRGTGEKWHRPADLAVKIDRQPTTVVTVLCRLCKEGRVEKGGKGLYRIPIPEV